MGQKHSSDSNNQGGKNETVTKTRDDGNISHHDNKETGESADATDPMVSQKQEQTKKVPDGGYGWFIVIGSFLCHVIIGGLERSDGINFMEFQKQFNKSAQLTAWPGALVSSLRLFLGPLAAVITQRFSVRASCLVGSVIMFIAVFLDGLAPDFFFLFFSHSLLGGLGRGLVYAPCLIIVGLYFDKRRSFATGLSSSGVGVGTFLMVPLVQFLFDTYGYQGSFMIVSAITLNTAVSAMLFRPLSLHYKFTEGKEDRQADKTDLPQGIVLMNAEDQVDSSSMQSWQVHHHCSRLSVNYHNGDDDWTSGEHTQEIKKEGCLKSSRKICFPVEKNQKAPGSKPKLFNFHLLKNPSFLMFCLSILVFTCAFKSAFTFLPALVRSQGFSKSEAAFVLSISGVADTFGRIFFGFIFDLKPVRKYRPILYNAFVFCISLVSVILPQLKTYPALCITCILYGMLTGGYISQKSVISVDILGVQNLASAFGLLICFQGFGICLGPPLSGALKDATGSFLPSFYLGGSFMLCGGCFMIASNIFLRRQQLQEQREIKTAS